MSDQALYTTIGVLMVLSGAALIAFGYRLHASVARTLDPEERAVPRWPRTITEGAVPGSLALSILIIVTT